VTPREKELLKGIPEMDMINAMVRAPCGGLRGLQGLEGLEGLPVHCSRAWQQPEQQVSAPAAHCRLRAALCPLPCAGGRRQAIHARAAEAQGEHEEGQEGDGQGLAGWSGREAGEGGRM
jgi:hypothetical protein